MTPKIKLNHICIANRSHIPWITYQSFLLSDADSNRSDRRIRSNPEEGE